MWVSPTLCERDMTNQEITVVILSSNRPGDITQMTVAAAALSSNRLL
jgi:hypothetical protein